MRENPRLSRDLPVGYGKGMIEPGIAPLVAAAQEAGFTTFSSCEGHPDRDDGDGMLHLQSVAFYATAEEALPVFLALRAIEGDLLCSWQLTCKFVLHWTTNEWVLGWSLESWGMTASESSNFAAASIASGNDDVPRLISMFASLSAA